MYAEIPTNVYNLCNVWNVIINCPPPKNCILWHLTDIHNNYMVINIYYMIMSQAVPFFMLLYDIGMMAYFTVWHVHYIPYASLRCWVRCVLIYCSQQRAVSISGSVVWSEIGTSQCNRIVIASWLKLCCQADHYIWKSYESQITISIS